MDSAGLPLLLRLIAMGTRSLLQYISESSPWATPNDRPALDRIVAIAREEREEAARLTSLLQKKHIRVPKTESFPSHFTTANFVSVEYLIPKLIVEHEKEIAAIERMSQPIDDEETRRLAQGYLEMKRCHLQTLRELSTNPAAATVL